MKLHRILAIAYRDLLIIRRSKWRLVEIFYFPLTTIIIWGMFALHSRTFAFEVGLFVLIVNVFWNFAYVAQSTVNMQMMEDSWSGSLKQLLLSGITEAEYVVGRMITSTIISTIVMLLMLFATLLFGWNPLEDVQAVIVIAVLTLVVSLAMAVLVTGMIIALGRSYGFLAWTALQAFVLLSAPFFPIDVFPTALQYVSKVMPYTYIFASARALATDSELFLAEAAVVALLYFILVWPAYLYCFRLARKNGNLVRMS